MRCLHSLKSFGRDLAATNCLLRSQSSRVGPPPPLLPTPFSSSSRLFGVTLWRGWGDGGVGTGGLGDLFDTRIKYSCRMVGEGEVGALFAHSTIHAATEEEMPGGDREGGPGGAPSEPA